MKVVEEELIMMSIHIFKLKDTLHIEIEEIKIIIIILHQDIMKDIDIVEVSIIVDREMNIIYQKSHNLNNNSISSKEKYSSPLSMKKVK